MCIPFQMRGLQKINFYRKFTAKADGVGEASMELNKNNQKNYAKCFTFLFFYHKLY